MASTHSKNSAPPSTEQPSPAASTSPDELGQTLRHGGKHDVFRYVDEAREVVLRNDCRSYPLRVQATFADGRADELLEGFVARCEAEFDISFQSSLPGKKTARIPGIASKVGVYSPLETVEVHFYKQAPRDARRRVIDWLVGR